jgi:hypothetical protein
VIAQENRLPRKTAIGSALGRGEKPTEPDDSWLLRTESQFHLKFTTRNNNPPCNFNVNLKRDSPLDTDTTFNRE